MPSGAGGQTSKLASSKTSDEGHDEHLSGLHLGDF